MDLDVAERCAREGRGGEQLPRGTGVGGFQHPLAGIRAIEELGFARAHIDDPPIAGREGHGPDRQGGLVIGLGDPGRAVIARFPHASLGAADQPVTVVARVYGDARDAPAQRSPGHDRGGADVDPPVTIDSGGVRITGLPQSAHLRAFGNVAQRVGALLEHPPPALGRCIPLGAAGVRAVRAGDERNDADERQSKG